MKKYKGYYIDNVVFHSEAEIDKFIEDRAIERYKNLCQYFAKHPSMEAVVICSEQAEVLHKNFGYSWTQIEQLECEALSC